MKETAAEGCEEFVSTNWGVEVAVMVGKCGFTEELLIVVTLHFVCNDTLGRYIKQGDNGH